MKLSEETKTLIIQENNAFKEKQYGGLSEEDRKKLGAFYTPGKIVIKMIEKFEWDSLVGKTILDPTCGSGNLLAGVLIAGADSDKVYGNEISSEMVILCRKRLNDVCDLLNKPHINDWQIHLGNALDPHALTEFGPEYCEAQQRELTECGYIKTGFTMDPKDKINPKTGKPYSPKKLKEIADKKGFTNF